MTMSEAALEDGLNLPEHTTPDKREDLYLLMYRVLRMSVFTFVYIYI